MGPTGIGIGGGSRKDAPAFARFAEELGYDSIWTASGPAGDTFSVLTACALSTSRIRLGTNVNTVFQRPPAVIAESAANVDIFSDGRMILGLGTDHRNQVVKMLGMPFEKAIPRLLESVDIMRALWRDGEVSYDGEIFKIEGYRMGRHAELPRPEIPIWMGAVNPKMLGIAGEIGHGAIMVNHTIDSVREARETLLEGAARAGKSPEDVTLAMMIPISLADTKDEARQNQRERWARAGVGGGNQGPGIGQALPRYVDLKRRLGFGEEWERMIEVRAKEGPEAAAKVLSDRYIDAFSICGTPGQARDRLEEWREAGVDLPIIGGGFSTKEALAITYAFAPNAH